MGDLAALVAAALRDPSVGLAYRPSPGAAWTDPDGHALTIDETDPHVTVAHGADGAAAAVIAHVDSDERARAARVWLEHARLRDELHVRVAEETALRRVAMLVAQHAAPEDVLAVVAEEVALHLHADAAMVTRFTEHGVATVLADWARPGLAPFPVGEAIALGDGTALHIQGMIAQYPDVKVTRLARGLPAGSNIEYANRNILADAISGRQRM